MRKFEDLAVWRDAHRLALNVYDITARFPAAERTVLLSQMRRSGNGVPGNICEGTGLDTNPQFARHLIIARGSSAELEYYVRLSRDLGYIAADKHEKIRSDIRAVRRQIWGLVRYLRR